MLLLWLLATLLQIDAAMLRSQLQLWQQQQLLPGVLEGIGVVQSPAVLQPGRKSCMLCKSQMLPDC